MVLSEERAGALRALIAGTGSIGRRHIANLRALQGDVQLAFLRDGARVDDYSRVTGAEVFGSLTEALAWRPDLAVVATPSDRHHELLAALLEHKVATFVEKPVVTGLADVEALEGLLAADEGPPTQTGCVLRFLPAVRTLRRWLDKGRAGTVVRASFECGQYLPDWRPGQDYRQSYSADSARGGGVIFDLVHELDLAFFLLGDVELLHAAAARRSDLEIAAEDTAVLLLRSAEGVPVSVSLDYVSRKPVRQIDIVGDLATLRLDFIGKRLERISADGVEEVVEGFDTDAAYRAELAELLAAREQRGATSLPIKEGLRSTRLAIAARVMAGLPS